MQQPGRRQPGMMTSTADCGAVHPSTRTTRSNVPLLPLASILKEYIYSINKYKCLFYNCWLRVAGAGDVVARKLNTSPDQCIIRFLHLYQQQLHRQLLAQRRPSRGAVMSVPSPSSSLSSSPSPAITDATGSSPYSTAATTGRTSSSTSLSSLSSSPAGSQHFTAPNYLSSSPSQQAPLFAYATKYAQHQPPLSGGSSGSGTPVGSPAASSFLGSTTFPTTPQHAPGHMTHRSPRVLHVCRVACRVVVLLHGACVACVVSRVNRAQVGRAGAEQDDVAK